jgi:YegS/Rv2252/BmrU family lipid kinase
VILTAGGDGTLNEVVNAVAPCDHRPALAALAAGTANDFARATGVLALTPVEAIRLAAEAEPTPIDVGRCNGQYFLNVASGGFGAEVTASTPGELKSVLGGLAYTLTGLFKILTDEERTAKITLPAGPWSGPVMLFTVANARMAGGGYVVGPGALLDDGLLNLQVVSSLGDHLSEYLGDLFVEQTTDVTRGPGGATPWLEIASPGALHVNLDGEPLTPTTSYRFTVSPRHLRFVLPPAAKALLTAGAATAAPLDRPGASS